MCVTQRWRGHGFVQAGWSAAAWDLHMGPVPGTRTPVPFLGFRHQLWVAVPTPADKAQLTNEARSPL